MALRKPIDIRKQPRLSFARTLRLTLNGVKYRLFRSSVTMAVITVAIAFLMNSATEGVIRSAVSRATSEHIVALKLAPRWSTRLTAVGTDESIVQDLALDRDLLSQSPDADLRRDAQSAVVLLDFFDDLAYGHRRQMVHNHEGVDILAALSTDAGHDRLQEALSINRSIRFPLSDEALNRLLDAWPGIATAVEAERQARRAAIAKVAVAMAGRKPLDALADAAFHADIRAAGFALSPEESSRLVSQAAELVDRRTLEITMTKLPVKKGMADLLDKLPSEISAALIWDHLLTSAGAESYHALCAKYDLALPYTAARAQQLAQQHRDQQALLKAERLSVGFGEGFMGLGERMSWLMLVSLLVCGVGIANAMLMSVTERFREIATLKCLGALDFFIMTMFVLEAGILGVIGGLLGAILGMAIGFGRMLALYGGTAVTSVQASELLLAMVVALVVGLALAVIAAVYPSFKAARLAPMEAMRIE